MKIAFICGSLEPGFDGVGDYTRRLAGELISLNHQVIIISIYDRNVFEQYNGSQSTNGQLVSVVRIPNKWKANKRFISLSNCLKYWQPDWVSLQFVGFGLHPYGLPFELLWGLKRSIGEVRLHIMLHELWCGMDNHSRLKEKILGYIQKYFLKILLSYIKPKFVFTSIQYYIEELSKINVIAHLSPIFSNISSEQRKVEEKVIVVEELPLIDSLNKDRNEWIIIGFFGTVYSCPGILNMLQCIADVACEFGKKFGVLSIGHNRLQGIDLIIDSINHITHWKLGSLSEQVVDKVIRIVDIGVLTSPANRANKSSSAAAFMERGINLIVSSEDITYSCDMEKDGIYQINNKDDVLRSIQRKQIVFQNRLANITAMYNFYLTEKIT